MRKSKVTLVLFLFCSLMTFGQDEGMFDRINGRPIKRSVYVEMDKDRNFVYSVDDDVIHSPIPLDPNTYFNIKNRDKNAFQVYIGFYNPLRTSLKSSHEDVDDPAYKAISDFIAKLPVGITKETVDKDEDKMSFQGTNMKELDVSVLLNEWIYKFYNLIDPEYIKEKKLEAEYNTVAEILNGVTKAESFLFETFTLPELQISEEKSLSAWIKFSGNRLYKVENNFDMFESSLKSADSLHSAVNNLQVASKKAINDVIGLLKEDFDKKVGPLIAFRMGANGAIIDNTNERKAFRDYSVAFAKQLVANTRPQLSIQETIINQHGDLIKKLTSFKDEFKGVVVRGNTINKGYKQDYQSKLDWKNKKMSRLTFDAKELNEDGSEVSKSNKSSSIIVGKKLGVYPFVSTGILYTNFSYPQYAVSSENGANKVARIEDVEVNLRPTVFLNMLIASWDPIYPFAQLGITTGMSDAIFPVGGGISFGPNFSVSAGWIFGYHKDLKKLQVGGSVKDEAQLKSDLTDKAVFKPFYISFNYNLGKK